MSKLEVGAKVRFTGFKEQESVDTATMEELAEQYPDFSAGVEATVTYVHDDGTFNVDYATAAKPSFLFANEVEVIG